MHGNGFRSFLFLACACLAISQATGYAESGKALGDPQAPIHIDLYSDYQCPGCKLLHDQTLGPLIDNYVKTGKAYMVWHEFPMPMHAHAREAASYACAAEKLGKYQQVGDQLFRTQEIWAKDGDVAGAACRGLSATDATKMRVLVKSPDIAAAIDNDIRAGQTEKVNGTPTLIIMKMLRRYPVTGPVSYAVLSKFLDSLLN